MDKKEELKKLFDSNQYSTLIVGETNDSVKHKEDKISTVISLLTDPENKDVREETLLTLKKEKGESLLIAAINNPKAKGKKHILVAACWESEINFSNQLPFFIKLAMDNDYLVSLEAITVIENMEGPFNEADVKESIKLLKQHQQQLNTEQVVLVNDLVNTLNGFITK